MAKKAHKKAMRAAKKLKAASRSGYSNDSNPFGDSNLNAKFVWRKKIERDVAQGAPLETFSVKAEKKRQRERMAETEKVKKRREERALEKAQHEDETALLARERAGTEFQYWEKKEEEFELDQSKIRSEIRLREGRAKPIAILFKHLNHGSDDHDIEPYMVFRDLTIKEMEELHDHIKMYVDLDRATPTHIQYWEALMVVCDWELAEARKKGALDRARVREDEPPAELMAEERCLHSTIEADVKNLLEGKSYDDLEALQSQIEARMCTGGPKVVEYWEAVLRHVHIIKAKACLRKRSQGLERPSEEARDRSGDGLKAEEDSDDDKHRLRKPKYFNTVNSSYNWNKYNKIHYDHENPPPKTVKGYKFNICYPDLVEKTPSYTIEKDGNRSETCIIRFHAGPPYEDIAFRILNDEWEYSPKKVFKCKYEHGILSLYFNFKRYRYRR